MTYAAGLALFSRQNIVRAGLSLAINEVPDLKVVLESENIEALVRHSDKYRTDLAILDIPSNPVWGLLAIKGLRDSFPSLPILVLSDFLSIRLLRESRQQGANGYILKSDSFESLRNAIFSLISGNEYVSPSLSQKNDFPTFGLTERQNHVLQCLIKGMSVDEAASKLRIKAKTVVSHRTEIMSKLKVRSRSQLILFALRQGMLCECCIFGAQDFDLQESTMVACRFCADI